MLECVKCESLLPSHYAKCPSCGCSELKIHKSIVRKKESTRAKVTAPRLDVFVVDSKTKLD